MIEPYHTWMEQHGPRNFREAYGQCKKYTDLMAAAFPNLKVRAGYYHCYVWGKRQHWWLETENGIVIDPTAMQFPSEGTCEYEFVEEGERPIGRCINCGGDVFKGSPCRELCSKSCEKEALAYLSGKR